MVCPLLSQKIVVCPLLSLPLLSLPLLSLPLLSLPLLSLSPIKPTNMRIAYQAKDIVEAEIIKGMLRANGIKAHTSGFYLQGAIGDLAATDFSRVHVHDDDYASARKLVKEYEAQLPVQDTPPTQIESQKSSASQKLIITIVIAIAISALIYWIAI